MDKTKYVVTGTPHVRSDETISRIMLDVIIALAPALIMSVFLFGMRAITLTLASVLSCVVAEFLYQKATKQTVTINDFSAVVTGILLAFNLPAAAPLWIPIVGGFFAIIVIKQLFGGLGQNFMNPALGARAFLLASYPSAMSNWSIAPSSIDAYSGVTPLVQLKEGFSPQTSDIINAFIGKTGGCIGETCAIALILGGIYLIARKVISWRIPVCYVGTVALLTLIFRRGGAPLYDLFTGGLMLGAFFMATDYSSSPITDTGKIVFGIGCGIITALIRNFSSSYPEGVSYSILLMNLAVPLIDRYTQPKIYGEVSKDAK